jgi:hypothetical protein
MNIYEIKNNDYDTKKVVAEDMEDALAKYRKYLYYHISVDYSYMEVFKHITSCEFVREYNEDDMIV